MKSTLNVVGRRSALRRVYMDIVKYGEQEIGSCSCRRMLGLRWCRAQGNDVHDMGRTGWVAYAVVICGGEMNRWGWCVRTRADGDSGAEVHMRVTWCAGAECSAGACPVNERERKERNGIERRRKGREGSRRMTGKKEWDPGRSSGDPTATTRPPKLGIGPARSLRGSSSTVDTSVREGRWWTGCRSGARPQCASTLARASLLLEVVLGRRNVVSAGFAGSSWEDLRHVRGLSGSVLAEWA